jgi:branched-chain amino acid aminotransferase
MKKTKEIPIILNGQVKDFSIYKPEESASIFYEVIRVWNGKILFIKDHLDRLKNSLIVSGLKCPEINTLEKQISKLINYVPIREGNIKITVYEQGGMVNTCCFQIPHIYPGNEEYKKGVFTKSFAFERPEPTIKKWNEQFRKRINQFIKKENIYEAILINEDGKLTEGSRSNLFFITGRDQILTAPDSQVLPGITRKYVLQISLKLHIELIQTALSIQEAATMKACFITGTSPMVLPVKKLNNIEFELNGDILKNLMSEYQNIIKQQVGH